LGPYLGFEGFGWYVFFDMGISAGGVVSIKASEAVSLPITGRFYFFQPSMGYSIYMGVLVHF